MKQWLRLKNLQLNNSLIKRDITIETERLIKLLKEMQNTLTDNALKPVHSYAIDQAIEKIEELESDYKSVVAECNEYAEINSYY